MSLSDRFPEIRRCEAGQRAEVLALLETCGLPPNGLADHWDTTWVAVDPAVSDAVLGSVALEIHGSAGLLRSLATRGDQRSRGIGHALFEFAMAQAKAIKTVSRDTVPESLRVSEEFRGVCPASATAMVRRVL